ncbi:hypothetical protein RYA05_03170 [Pseudomonas syringae pv. actinidiae]|nr:hypothetical protein [Pseudomonas syringae pv. actinidiae]
MILYHGTSRANLLKILKFAVNAPSYWGNREQAEASALRFADPVLLIADIEHACLQGNWGMDHLLPNDDAIPVIREESDPLDFSLKYLGGVTCVDPIALFTVETLSPVAELVVPVACEAYQPLQYKAVRLRAMRNEFDTQYGMDLIAWMDRLRDVDKVKIQEMMDLSYADGFVHSSNAPCPLLAKAEQDLATLMSAVEPLMSQLESEGVATPYSAAMADLRSAIERLKGVPETN